MIKYNLVIIEDKQCIPFLNLSEQEFYDKLWEWTYEDDLWDYIDDDHPDEETLNNAIATEEDFEDNTPGGDIDAIEVIYDEREK